MRNYILVLKSFLLFWIFVFANNQVRAQSDTISVINDPQALYDIIVYHDSLFWSAYNSCDLELMRTFFTDDLEFYHDKGGLSKPLDNFMENIKNGICANENWRLRREVVPGSTSVYPIQGYGALFTGDHIFYITEKDNQEKTEGKARFMHVWQFKDNEWKMSRVMSYDHKPVEYKSEKLEVTLTEEELMQLVGRYKSAQFGIVTITKDENQLLLQSGEFKATIYPKSDNTFFIKERDIEFQFMKGENDQVLKMIVKENNEAVDEAMKVN